MLLFLRFYALLFGGPRLRSILLIVMFFPNHERSILLTLVYCPNGESLRHFVMCQFRWKKISLFYLPPNIPIKGFEVFCEILSVFPPFLQSSVLLCFVSFLSWCTAYLYADISKLVGTSVIPLSLSIVLGTWISYSSLETKICYPVVLTFVFIGPHKIGNAIPVLFLMQMHAQAGLRFPGLIWVWFGHSWQPDIAERRSTLGLLTQTSDKKSSLLVVTALEWKLNLLWIVSYTLYCLQ